MRQAAKWQMISAGLYGELEVRTGTPDRVPRMAS